MSRYLISIRESLSTMRAMDREITKDAAKEDELEDSIRQLLTRKGRTNEKRVEHLHSLIAAMIGTFNEWRVYAEDI